MTLLLYACPGLMLLVPLADGGDGQAVAPDRAGSLRPARERAPPC